MESRLKKIVTVGGGTGGFMLNGALLHCPGVSRTAISTVFDSGGSTGRLRDAHGVLPSGDIRRILVALADDSDGRGETLRELFPYRFPEGNGSVLHDHSIGNLLLAAAEDRWGRLEGLRRVSSLLNVQGMVYPISLDDAHVVAELSDGSIVYGEEKIDTRIPSDKRTIRSVRLEPSASILKEAAEALKEADIVVLGPGDHYTSLMPNLLVDGFAEALEESHAKVVYVANLMTKASETAGFSVISFVRDLLIRYRIGRDRFDAVLLNTAQPPDELLVRYRQEECAELVICPSDRRIVLEGLSGVVVEDDFLDREALSQGLIRHDGEKLVRAILAL